MNMPTVSTCKSCLNGHCKTHSHPRPTVAQANGHSEGKPTVQQPSSIERYQAEDDSRKAFLAGQPTSSHRSPLDVSKDLEQWEERWMETGADKAQTKQ